MKIKHETTFNSLGSTVQMGILKKNKEYAEQLIKNPRITIVIEVE